MEKQQYTSLAEQEKERKRSNFSKLGKILYGGGAVLALTGIVGGTFYGRIPQNRSQIVETHYNAENTLRKLESISENLTNKISVTYETPEVKEALDRFYAQDIVKSNEIKSTIRNIRQDMDEMEINSDFIKYKTEKEKSQNMFENWMLVAVGGLATMLLGLIPIYLGRKKNTLLNNIEKGNQWIKC